MPSPELQTIRDQYATRHDVDKNALASEMADLRIRQEKLLPIESVERERLQARINELQQAYNKETDYPILDPSVFAMTITDEHGVELPKFVLQDICNPEPATVVIEARVHPISDRLDISRDARGIGAMLLRPDWMGSPNVLRRDDAAYKSLRRKVMHPLRGAAS